MEIRLFKIECKNEECGFSSLIESTEHMNCPNCGEETLEWSSDSIIVETYDIFKSDIYELIEDKRDLLAAIIIASSYVSGDSVIARYEDDGENAGFGLNMRTSEFVDEMVKLFNLKSEDELVSLIYNEFGDIHASLIYDPIFDCIERDSYSDIYGNLYESGSVTPSIAKKFYQWIKENKGYIAEILNEEE